MKESIYRDYVEILNSELILARGCTEPISIAYAAAKAREVLGTMPESCHVKCSGNIVKNVNGVIVPKAGGLRGIEIAAILGIVGGNAKAELDVLKSVTEDDSKEAAKLLASGFCSCELVQGVSNLYLTVEVIKGADRALVEITDYHTNITRIQRNETVLLERKNNKSLKTRNLKESLSVAGIIQFADSVNTEDVANTLDMQLHCNLDIASVGLRGGWGAEVGKILMEKNAVDDIEIRAAATAAAASDARMNGCDLPVVINSGSGNQGITVSIPVYIYAKESGATHDEMLRALAVSNLIALHQKRYIGNLSAYCGAVSAACGAACGIAYMRCGRDIKDGKLTEEERYNIICYTITNTICTIGGMVCDGAKSSCASKIAAAVRTALMAMDMGFKHRVFQNGEGLVKCDIEKTIAAVGRMGREGMKTTDVEILNMMLEH